MSALDGSSVRRVRDVLAARGSAAEIVELAETARSAEDAARSVGCDLGAIVKSLVFRIGERPVMALVAGDRRCDPSALPGILGIEGKVGRADADLVRSSTGFAIGGVAPVGHGLPVAIDASLARFGRLWAAAGHPHCVFAATLDELRSLTGGTLSERLAPAP